MPKVKEKIEKSKLIFEIKKFTEKIKSFVN